MPTSWFEVLESARVLSSSEKSNFTAADLMRAAHLSELKLASAWLSKFAKWGYVIKAGVEPGAGKKPFTVYKLSNYGKTVEPKSSHRQRLEQLLAGVDRLTRSLGKPEASQAIEELSDLSSQLKKGLAEEDKKRVDANAAKKRRRS